MHRRKRPVIKVSDAPNPFSPRPTEQVASAGGLECHAARLIGCPTPAGPLNRNVLRPTSLLAWYRQSGASEAEVAELPWHKKQAH